jgi:hypothetical protein
MASDEPQPLRVYADTSVYGGVFDEEFGAPSQAFFNRVREGRFRLVVSALILSELRPAPEPVRVLLDEMLAMSEIVAVSDEALVLQQAYLENGIVTPRAADDALHVGLGNHRRVRNDRQLELPAHRPLPEGATL